MSYIRRIQTMAQTFRLLCIM